MALASGCDSLQAANTPGPFDLVVDIHDPHEEELIAQSEGQVLKKGRMKLGLQPAPKFFPGAVFNVNAGGFPHACKGLRGLLHFYLVHLHSVLCTGLFNTCWLQTQEIVIALMLSA
jgi:hypothetical protein